MTVENIHTYLVHPGKGTDTAPQIGGTEVPLQGRLFDLLNGIYVKSSTECNIDISFNPSADGTQYNPCRQMVLHYLQQPSLPNGRQLADRLEKVTTHRSGLGLLFLIAGKEGTNHKLVVSRFPADIGILAEENQRDLTVAFLERVFMRNAATYKSALYEDISLSAGFWMGRAVDKQVNSSDVQISKYWIAEFLDSDFRTTSAAATRRLAVALREAARKSSDIQVKQDIAAAVTLADGLQGTALSILDFGSRFNLSDAAIQAISDEIRSPTLLQEQFQFDASEFTRQVAYRSVELDSGGLLTAPTADFENVFRKELIDDAEHRVRFSAEGKIINEKIGKSK